MVDIDDPLMHNLSKCYVFYFYFYEISFVQYAMFYI